MLLLIVVLGFLWFGDQLVGQDDSVGESNATEAIDSSIEETDEEIASVGSDNEEGESSDNDTQNSEEDSSAVKDSSTEEDSTNEESSNEETEESDDTDFEDFVPSENISEDIEIPFPTDI